MNPNPKFLIAVDPGAAGGLAWFEPMGTTRPPGASAVKMPDTDESLLALCCQLRESARLWWRAAGFEELPPGARLMTVRIELVGGYVKPAKAKLKRGEDGSVEGVEVEGGQPGSAMFKFGESAGIVRGMLLALGAEVELVPPKKWQEPLFLKKGDATKTAWKNTLKNAAQRRFPGLKVTLATADALLLLAYSAAREGLSGLLTPGTGQRGQDGPASAPAAPELPVGAPPPGFVIVSPDKGETTRAADLVWNFKAGEWVPVDSVNEYVAEYRAVARRGTMGDLYLAEWKGTPWVAKRGARGDTLLRRATAEDVRTLPRGAKP